MPQEHLESRVATVHPRLPTVCRTCLKDETSEEIELYQISEIFLGEGEVTAHIQSFEEVLGLFVNDELGRQHELLPETICLQCVEKARLAFQFIEMCRVTDSILELCLSKNDSKAETKTVKSDDEVQKNSEPIVETDDCADKCIAISDEETSVEFELIDQENSSHGSAYSKLVCANKELDVVLSTVVTVNCNRPRSRKRQVAPQKTCDICHKTFSQPQTLTRHKKIHNKDSDPGVKCEYCSKTFLRPDDLRRHIRTHTDERPYACDVCPKAYRQLSELKDHKANSHPKEGDSRKIFPCSMCGKQLTTRNGLYIHMKVHRGEKNHQCTFCGRRYVTTGELLSHQRHKHGHERDVNMLKCESPGCSERFATKLALKRHWCNVHERSKDLPTPVDKEQTK